MKRVTLYAHGNRESVYAAGERAGLEGEELMKFRHTLTEVEVVLDVDPDDAFKQKVVSVKIDGKPFQGAG